LDRNIVTVVMSVPVRRCCAARRSAAALLSTLCIAVSAVQALAAPRDVVASSGLARSSAAVVTASVSPNRRAQRLDGFGAATAYYQSWLTANPNKQEIYTALFSELKLDILRLQNDWRPAKSGSIADDADVVRGAAKAAGHPVAVLLCSWSPPAALKSNNSENNGGTLARANGRFVYDAFAQYWVNSLAAFQGAGIRPTWVSIQNEPDWKAQWGSCLFKPTEQTADGMDYAGYDRALDAVYRALHTRPDAPRLVGAEPTGIGDNNMERYIDPATATGKQELHELSAVAHHLYNGGTHQEPDTFIPMLHGIRDAYPAKPKMMTEYGDGDQLQTAELIMNCMTEESASAYVFWSAVWPDGGDAMIHIDNPWQRGSWKHPDGWARTPQFWAMKHFSAFTAPGWYRVSAALSGGSPAVRVCAFVSPDGKQLTVVLLNTSNTLGSPVRVNAAGWTGAWSSVYLTTEDKPWSPLGPLAADRSVEMPPRSIATVTLAMKGAHR
jgi:glucuronoarabinoxylan endo-1,4-beta-xylanase